jgi:hypothetical protein
LTISDNNHHDDFTIPLELAGCMVNFEHCLPNKEEFKSLQNYCLPQGHTPWNPSSFSDKVAGVFYKQVTDTQKFIVRK